jgi:HD superfamily phosphohydrolase
VLNLAGTRKYEFRDPIYGFVKLNDWERAIVNHSAFQRLRRIKQLAWTNMVYPGAEHTRFEHSLGVMHVATEMFNGIVSKRQRYLLENINYDEGGIIRDLCKLRLASLLHDIGHPPFSHAAENLMPINPKTGKTYNHEDYSSAIVRLLFQDVIENHPFNQNTEFESEHIANFLTRDPSIGRSLLWCDLLSGQLDADRADYLLRDAHHIGVEYGRYDLNRLLVTMTIGRQPEGEGFIIAVENGGEHAAEGLIIARYMMFTQVYYQRTRRAYDYHIEQAIKHMLAEEQKDTDLEQKDCFPPPTSVENLHRYLKWDDWKVLGRLAEGGGGEHGEIIRNRNHYRWVHQTPEAPSTSDMELANSIIDSLADQIKLTDTADKSWYKFSKEEEIHIINDIDSRHEKAKPLSKMSSVVKGLPTIRQIRLYSTKEEKEEVRKRIEDLRQEIGGLS